MRGFQAPLRPQPARATRLSSVRPFAPRPPSNLRAAPAKVPDPAALAARPAPTWSIYPESLPSPDALDGVRLKEERVTPRMPVQRYPYISSDPPETRDSEVYGIYETDDDGDAEDPCLYVGQTLATRMGNRFVEHATNDAGQPWHIGGGNDYSGNLDTWPYVPSRLEELKGVTRFETTAAEQWWYQDKGGGAELYNPNQVMLNATFNNYKDIDDNYDHTNIGVAANWKPTDD